MAMATKGKMGSGKGPSKMPQKGESLVKSRGTMGMSKGMSSKGGKGKSGCGCGG